MFFRLSDRGGQATAEIFAFEAASGSLLLRLTAIFAPVPAGHASQFRKNENLLQEIASAGAGIYVRANNSKAGLSALFAEINKMEKKRKMHFNSILLLVLLALVAILYLSTNRTSIKGILLLAN